MDRNRERDRGGGAGPGEVPGDGLGLREVRGGVGAELRFLASLWKANLLSAMEYRTSFVLQVAGMALNNAVFMLFWVIFFERFENVGGWGMLDLVRLYGVVAMAFGIGVTLFGNVLVLSDVISGGGLDHHLSLPRPVLLSALASRSRISGIGDILTGIVCFGIAGEPSAAGILRFALAVTVSAAIFLAFLVAVQSLAFWMGGATMLNRTAINAIITFSTYPLTLFDGTAKLVLLTIIPAGVMGTVSAEFVHAFTWSDLGALLGAALAALAIALWIFHRGLRRYESGSAIVAGSA